MPTLSMIDDLVAGTAQLGSAWKTCWAPMAIAALLIGAWLWALNVRVGVPERWAVGVAALVAIAATRAGLYRRALGIDGGERRVGPSWAAATARLAIAWLLKGIFLLVVGLLIFVAALAAAYGAASAGRGFVASDAMTWAASIDSRGRILLAVVAALGGWALAWAWARVAFSSAASVEKGRVLMLAAWPLTQGLAWRLAAGRAAIALAVAALFLALQAGMRAGPGAETGVRLAQGLLVAGLWFPLDIGLTSHLYRQVAQDRSGAGR